MEDSKGNAQASSKFITLMATVGGVACSCFWSSSVAVIRVLSKELPKVTSTAAIFLMGGSLGLLFVFIRNVIEHIRSRRNRTESSDEGSPASPAPSALSLFKLREPINWKYTLINGFLFVSNSVTFAVAIDFASSNEVVLEVGLINYLWPAFTVACTVWILKFQTRYYVVFPIGLILALCGAALVTAGAHFSVSHFFISFRNEPFIYLMAVFAAASWPLYSALCRKWSQHARAFHVPVFLFASGLSLLLIGLAIGEYDELRPMSTFGGFELLYAGLVPNFAGYQLWEYGMRRGNATFVSAFSNLIPMLSTMVSSLMLHVEFTLNFAIGSVCIVAGAVLCKISVIEPTSASDEVQQVEMVEKSRILDDQA